MRRFIGHGVCFTGLLAVGLGMPTPAGAQMEHTGAAIKGWLRFELKAQTRALVGLPFAVEEKAWRDLLTNTTVAATAWSAHEQTYATANEECSAGQGVWLHNTGANDGVVYLWGDVFDETVEIMLSPELNLIANPFPSAPESESGRPDAEILNDHAEVHSGALEIGKGYWAKTETMHVWRVSPPPGMEAGSAYLTALFPTEEGIDLLLVNPTPTTVTLAILGQTLSPTGTLDFINGWQRLESGLSLAANAEIIWRDTASRDVGRLYKVVAAPSLNSDLEAERSGHGDGEGSSMNDQASMEADAATLAGLVEGASMPELGTAIADTTNTTPSLVRFTPRKAIFVSAMRGQDHFTGRQAIRVGVDGPKKTLHGGLAVAEDGDQVLVETGRYSEPMHIAGRDVRVRITGTVDIRGDQPPVFCMAPTAVTNEVQATER